MNFRKKEPVVDLDELDRALAKPGERSTAGPGAFAQPHIRNDPAHPANQGWRLAGPVPPNDERPVIATFEELPTKEIDEILKAAHEELASIVEHASAVKQMHAEHAAQIKGDIERLRENIKLAKGTFDSLREQIVALDAARNGKRAAAGKAKPAYEKPQIREVSDPNEDATK